MFLKRISSSLVFTSFFLLFFLSLLFYGASVNDNFSFASNVKPGDEGCYDRGGECMTFGHTRDYGPCGSNGYIRPNLCNSSTSQYYRCCIPIDESADSACESLGGECQFFHHDGPSGSCIVNEQLGEIVPSKCDGAVSDHYRCCKPLKDEVEPACGSLATEYPYVVNDWPAGDFCSEGQSNPANPNFPFPGGETTWLCMDRGENVSCSATRLKEDRVASDLACEEVLGGQCQWTDSGGSGDLGECLVNGNPGCYIFGACREEPHSIKGGEFYLCCTDDEEFCGGGVEYEKWNDVYLNGDCPFSKPSLEEDRLWCSQGPDTTPSHHRAYTKPSVDIILASDGSPGSEYFIAPDNGVITKAKAFYQQGDEKCGCELVFETDGGVVYEIRHCFLFAGIGQHYDQTTGQPMQEPLTVKKGEVLGRIADHSDSQIIDHAGGCSSGPHFHVKVEGGDVDRCVDCYFVDKLGCNLYNDGSRSHKGQCGRCYREEGIPDCFDPSWGALCDDGCAGCNVDSQQYCCESDRVECCDPWGNCRMVCDCPHPSPGQ